MKRSLSIVITILVLCVFSLIAVLVFSKRTQPNISEIIYTPSPSVSKSPCQPPVNASDWEKCWPSKYKE